MNPFVEYTIAEVPGVPPISEKLFEYVLGARGVYVRSKRTGLEFCQQIAATAVKIRGLSEIEPYVRLEYERVSAGQLAAMMELSRAAKDQTGEPIERLFHIARG